MTVQSSSQTADRPGLAARGLARFEERLTRTLPLDREHLLYLVILVLAILSRFWDLGLRVMSHDESLHTRFSWNLYVGDGFAHTPMMHGPLLFHMTALNYLLFGDNDFTGRIYTAVIGVIVVMMPYFMRRWLGRSGALFASVGLLISPMILYYSRYIRHDIPAILSAMVIAVATWRYIETRKFPNLVWIAGAFAVLFASKEVSFIYVAIYGSFLTIYLVTHMLDVKWESRGLYVVFFAAVIAALAALLLFGVVYMLDRQAPAQAAPSEAGPVEPLNPDAPIVEPEPAGLLELSGRALLAGGLLGVCVLTLAVTAVIGQWRHLRDFPELSVAMVLGTLILPQLTPFLIVAAGYKPLDATPEGVMRGILFTAPMVITAAVIGLIYFMEPPRPRPVRPAIRFGEGDEGEIDDLEVQRPGFGDWVTAFLTSRWWAIGGLYWLFTLFFFTTMFTNGSGIGTGVIGSLGYWLEQQAVKRGNQPWFYYLAVQLPIYEFMPVILSMAAGAVGLAEMGGRLVRWVMPAPPDDAGGDDADKIGGRGGEQLAPLPPRSVHDPLEFPVLGFLGYLAVMNVIAYSIAGEKMPWLTTHLTWPMILIGGWLVGRTVDRIDWRGLIRGHGWLLIILLPLLAVTLLRVLGPACRLRPAALLCNTIIPLRYQQGVLAGRTTEALAATGVWVGALVVLTFTLVGIAYAARRVRAGDVTRLVGLLLVAWLAFLTIRASWRASYVTYDEATEFLVYAHSAGAVKDVLAQIEEISLKTTDGYGLRVAYDNRVSWPMSWYLRDYYNAVYYGDQPSRGLIGDAPVILAGPGNWNKIDSLVGDRYYKFEYIRMWWPMEDYRNISGESIRAVLNDPALQRGLWEIFYNRNYEPYADAVAPYRGGQRPDLSLRNWPVAERMYVYIRKDTFAQVWDYGVAASEIAEAVDPYAAGARALTPSRVFGTGLLNRPHGMDIGPDGLLYVADSLNHRVAVFNPQSGALVNTFGVYGLAPTHGALNEPWDVAVGPEGTVYVADTWNFRVSAFSPQGEFLTAWGVEGPNQLSDPFAFWGPRGIAVDRQGIVYVADTGNKRIQSFDGEGGFLRQIGSGGSFDGQLDEPAGLAVGPDGLIYVADTWNQRIQVFSPGGLFVRQWLVEGWFAQTNERPYIAVDGAGSVYVTDPEAFRVIVFNGVGEYLYSFGDFSTIGLAGGIAVDDEGNLYISDTANGTIQRYDAALLQGSSQPAQ
ncbi:MAG: hypothetical protein Kow00124_28720 [Anaerolineae bacterium]